MLGYSEVDCVMYQVLSYQPRGIMWGFSMKNFTHNIHTLGSPNHTFLLFLYIGHHVDILRHGEVFVLSDGSLQLSTNDSDSTEGGSGMMPLFPTGNPLPTIPSDVGAVTISWHANEMVSKGLT